jgi:hypothetical protein
MTKLRWNLGIRFPPLLFTRLKLANMKKQPFLILGLSGVIINLAIFLGLSLTGNQTNLLPFVMPWVAFVIIGVVKAR